MRNSTHPQLSVMNGGAYPMSNGLTRLQVRFLGEPESVGEAFVWMYRIETACRQQIDALSGGSELSPLSKETQQKSIEMGLKMYGKGGFIEVGREWPALLRQLERHSGIGYRD